MIVAISPILVVSLIGRIAKGVQLPAHAWVQIGLGIWLATLPFALLGLLIGQLADAQNLPAYLNGTLMMMALLGGLFIPIVSFPDWMVRLAKVLPTYWIGEIGRGALTGNTQFAAAVAVLAGWTVGLAALVAWRYQRATGRT
jgi:ABC-2 type transport system permease protein